MERQPSASPFHDWNARITSECYRRLLHAPILDDDGGVAARVDCWSRISFDVGPTLMRWLRVHAHDVHDGIVAADRLAVARDGRGAGFAQAYHHAILPLCSPEDRRTEIRWGLRDFEVRFGRRSEGLWLPECAADTATLRDVADAGVAFVVLAPGQAVGGADTRRPHRIKLPGKRKLAAFFYDGGAAQGVAFGGWLHDGEGMARRLAAAGPGLVHLATDGESYGHHHRHGEMALAYAIKTWDEAKVPLGGYGAWLAAHPAKGAVAVVSPSAWSCAHGVGRWSEDCGCGTVPGGGAWRPILRRALNRLRDRIDAWSLPRIAASGEDPLQFRDQLIETLLAEEGFAGCDDPLKGTHDHQLRELLGIQRLRLMMFTSCGWFFDDPGGLEAVQVLRYAAFACQRVHQAGGPDLLRELADDLAPMRSTDPAAPDGRSILATKVLPH